MTTSADGFFSDLKVIELASVLAGPSVGQFFAELGAEVIKVENPATKGDVTRSWKLPSESAENDRPAYFCSVNRGKKSLALDIRQPQEREQLYRLIQEADLVIASYKPGDAEKLGVDFKTLSQLNEKLIYGSISGYGPENPRVGYDAIIQAEAGFMFMNGEPGGNSLKMPVALMDVLAAHQLKEALLLALMQRQKSGKGLQLEVSLIQAAVSALVNQASNWLVAGHIPQKMGSAHPNIAPYGKLFNTKNNRQILLAVGNDKQFQRLCELINLPSLPQDKRFANNAGRVRNRKALEEILAQAIGQFEAEDLLQQLQEAKVPAGAVNSMPEVFQMPKARQLLFEDLKGVSQLAFQGFSKTSHLLPPPRFGEHNQEIFTL